MQIYNFGWLGLPIVIYFIVKKYYLHSGELWLLFYTGLLLFSTIFGNWLMQITHLIIVTAMSIHVLSICKQTNGSVSQRRYNILVRIIFHLEEEFSIFLYMLSSWLLLRIYTNKTYSFGIGFQYQDDKIFMGVNQTLNGWNCTQFEFVLIPFIWVIFNITSYIIGNLIMKVQMDKDNLYKQFVLKYKVIPDIIFSLIACLFNFYSYKNADSLFQCCKYWQLAYPMGITVYYGFSVSTIYFFYVKKGIFLIEGEQNTSDKAENEDRRQIQMDVVR